MPSFLVQVRTAQQEEQVIRVEADDLAGARSAAEAAGHVPLQFLTGEMEARFQQLLSPAERAALSSQTPEQAAKIREGGGIVAILRANWLLVLMFATCLWWVYTSASVWSLVAALGVTALVVMLVIPSSLYMQLVRARTRADWRTARLMAATLRWLASIQGGNTIKSEVDFTLACADASTGRLSAALARVERWRQPLGAALFEGRLGSVYAAAHQYEEAIACSERALDASGGAAEQAVDVALQLVQYRFDATRIRELLAYVDGKVTAELITAAVALCNGALQVSEQRGPEAVETLTQARAVMAKYGAITEGPVALFDCYLALALKQADDSQWQAAAARALPLLEATGHPLGAKLRAA